MAADIRNSSRYKRQRAKFFKDQGRYGVCHICGETVDMSLDGRTPAGRTVDHVIPLTAGGDPFALSNWALAHNRCNKLKGMGSVSVGPRAARPDLTPGDPSFCWVKKEGLWHHYRPSGHIRCQWPDCANSALHLTGKVRR